jgi:hypothetical protein
LTITCKSKEEIKVGMSANVVVCAFGPPEMLLERRRVRFGKWKIPLSFHITPSLYFKHSYRLRWRKQNPQKQQKTKTPMLLLAFNSFVYFFPKYEGHGRDTGEATLAPHLRFISHCIGK